MALTVTPTPDIQLGNAERLTVSKLNRLAKSGFSVDGTLATANLEAGAVTSAKTKAGPHFYAATCTLAAGVYTLTWGTDLGPASLASGLLITFKTDAANVAADGLSGAVDLNAGFGGAKNLYKLDGTELGKAELAAGTIVIVIYDGTQFKIVSVTRSDMMLPPNLVVNLRAYCSDPTYDDFNLSVGLVVLTDANGARCQANNVAVSVDAGNTGANGRDAGSFTTGWWFLWVISTGTVHAGLVSLSETAPTLPAGYTFKALVGAYFCTGTSWRPFYQRDRDVWQVSEDVWSLAQTAPTTYTVLDATANGLANFQDAVPTIARSVRGYIGVTNNQPCSVRISACDTGGAACNNSITVGENNIQMADSGLALGSPATRAGSNFEVPMLAIAPNLRNLQWKGVAGGTGSYQMEITGYTI